MVAAARCLSVSHVEARNFERLPREGVKVSDKLALRRGGVRNGDEEHVRLVERREGDGDVPELAWVCGGGGGKEGVDCGEFAGGGAWVGRCVSVDVSRCVCVGVCMCVCV